MKSLIKIVAMIFVCTLFCFIEAKSQKNEINGKPNILLIITDQQTADAMSCAGNPYLKTPAMDKLAATGVRFERNYVTQPLCLPFRSSLQTSRYPHEIGTVSNGTKIQGEFPMLGNLVAEAGYNCDYIGKWHVGIESEKAGYEDYDNVGIDDKKAEAAQKYFLRSHEKPFFLTVSLMNPHNVCQLARADGDGSDLPDGPIGLSPTNLDELPPLPNNFNVSDNEPSVLRAVHKSSFKQYPTANWDELTWRQYLWGYYRLVEKVDTEIGKILKTLNESSYNKNTVVIFTSDHGEGMAMHHWNQKQVLYDQVTRVPLIISWNGKSQNKVYSGLVSNALDIPVTILDIAGVEKPGSMRGQSLMPILNGQLPKPGEFVVSETMFAENAEPLGGTGRMIRTKNYKYCIYDNGESREQLFDMQNDPGEMNNLVSDNKFKTVLDNHRKLITGWAKETNDTTFPYISPQQ